MAPVAVVHDPDGRQIGEDHSTDRNPTTGLTLGTYRVQRSRMLRRCDDFGRLDMAWLYAADESDSMSEYQPTLLPMEEVMEEESLPLGLAVS